MTPDFILHICFGPSLPLMFSKIARSPVYLLLLKDAARTRAPLHRQVIALALPVIRQLARARIPLDVDGIHNLVEGGRIPALEGGGEGLESRGPLARVAGLEPAVLLDLVLDRLLDVVELLLLVRAAAGDGGACVPAEADFLVAGRVVDVGVADPAVEAAPGVFAGTRQDFPDLELVVRGGGGVGPAFGRGSGDEEGEDGGDEKGRELHSARD